MQAAILNISVQKFFLLWAEFATKMHFLWEILFNQLFNQLVFWNITKKKISL